MPEIEVHLLNINLEDTCPMLMKKIGTNFLITLLINRYLIQGFIEINKTVKLMKLEITLEAQST